MSRAKSDERVYRRGARRMSGLKENSSVVSGLRGTSLSVQNIVLRKSVKMIDNLLMEVIKAENYFFVFYINHIYIYLKNL